MSTFTFSSAATFLEDPALMEPFTHVAGLPSKNIRGYFVDALAKNLLRLPQSSVNKLQEATAILHSASLLFDDIEDGTQVRRGEPAAHVIFGMPLTLNAASAATCAALEVMLKDEDDDEDDEKRKNKMLNGKEENLSGSHNQHHQKNNDCYDPQDGEMISPNKSVNNNMDEDDDEMSNRRQESQIANKFAVSSSFSARQLNNNCEDPNSSSFDSENLDFLKRAALQGRLTRVYIDTMKLLHSGQGKDIYWRDIHQCPSLPDYRLMARQKTGGLFRLVAMWALELERHLKSGKNNIHNHNDSSTKTKQRNTLLLSLCDDFGLCFQILDDVANLCDEELHKLKTFADDLDEGKFSYPAIHCILAGENKTPQKDKRLLHALSTNASSTTTSSSSSSGGFTKKSIPEKEFCLHLMKESGSIKASCHEVLSLCEMLKEKTVEIISLNVVAGEEEADDDEAITRKIENEKCKKILLGLIAKMTERAMKFSSF